MATQPLLKNLQWRTTSVWFGGSAHRCCMNAPDAPPPPMGLHTEKEVGQGSQECCLWVDASRRRWGGEFRAPMQHLWSQSAELCQNVKPWYFLPISSHNPLISSFILPPSGWMLLSHVGLEVGYRVPIVIDHWLGRLKGIMDLSSETSRACSIVFPWITWTKMPSITLQGQDIPTIWSKPLE